MLNASYIFRSMVASGRDCLPTPPIMIAPITIAPITIHHPQNMPPRLPVDGAEDRVAGEPRSMEAW